MDLIELLWEGHQQRGIWKAQDQLHNTGLSLDLLREQLSATLDRLDHANLVILAMWELVAEKMGLTVEQLRAKVTEIDLRDGVQDGKYSGPAPGVCTGCNRPIHPKRTKCMYCGLPRRGLGLGDAAVGDKPT